MAQIDINLRLTREDELFMRLLRIESFMEQILQKDTIMVGELDALKVEVQETTTLMGSAMVLLKGLKDKLDAAISDPVALAALSKELDDKQKELAAAITANTPAE